MKREDLREALSNPNVAAFLRVIRQGESRQDDSAYTIMFGGQHFDAPPWLHPLKLNVVGSLKSTAAGAYQFLSSTWAAVQSAYGLPDFSPQCQDEAAVALIKGRGALEDVKAGRLEEAIKKCSREWASLPYSPYGQPTMKYEQALLVYRAWGGRLAEPAPQPAFNPDSLETEHYGDKPMSPFILPALEIAAKFIPQLAEKFASGSEVAKRNVAAGHVIAEAITAAAAEPNIQAAVEKIASDEGAREAAKQAVAVKFAELFEVGGGVDAARKASKSGELPFWLNGAFWISLILILMPFMLLVDIFYVHPANYDANLRTQIVTAVLMVIGMVGAFWLGTSFGSQRKTNILAEKG